MGSLLDCNGRADEAGGASGAVLTMDRFGAKGDSSDPMRGQCMWEEKGTGLALRIGKRDLVWDVVGYDGNGRRGCVRWVSAPTGESHSWSWVCMAGLVWTRRT